jgi:hypothetical protein
MAWLYFQPRSVRLGFTPILVKEFKMESQLKNSLSTVYFPATFCRVRVSANPKKIIQYCVSPGLNYASGSFCQIKVSSHIKIKDCVKAQEIFWFSSQVMSGQDFRQPLYNHLKRILDKVSAQQDFFPTTFFHV